MKSKILLLLFVLNLAILLPLPGKFSYVYNENGRIASGLIRIKTGDYSVFHVNPPLPDMVGALPAFLAGNYCPTIADLGMSHFGRMEYKAGAVWIQKNPDHFCWMIVGRYAMLIFVLIGTCGIFLWAKEQFGIFAAVISSLSWMFSPYILGFGCLVGPDVASASFAVLAVFMFHKWLKRQGGFNALLAGLTLGLAELCKFTLLIFYPLFVLIWILYRIPDWRMSIRKELFLQAKTQAGQLIVIFATSLLVINMGYLFENTGKQLGSFKFQTSLLSGVDSLEKVPSGGANRFANTLLGKIPVLLPANFVQGIDTQRLDFERGLPSYLRGEWSEHGWWYYYLYALLIKTPLGTLGLFLLAIFCTFFIRNTNTAWRDEMVILLPGIVILAFVSSQTGFFVHSRYVIPALPFFFVWMSKVGKAISWQRPFFSTLALSLLLWSVSTSHWIYPHSISYFNEFAAVLPTPEDKNYPKIINSPKTFWQKIKYSLDSGPRNGPRHLLDSNIDWGQDLFYLEKWCKVHPEVTEIKCAVWGSYPLDQTSIPDTGMPPANKPQPGWYALSVNYLYDREKQYRYFWEFEPVDIIGYSIYVYHLTEEDIAKTHK